MRLILLTLLSFFGIHKVLALTLDLPKPTGPYNVGTENIMFSDASRKMLRGSEKRRWMATLFYPATQSSAQTYPYMPGTLKDSTVFGVKVLSYAKPQADPFLGQKFPVIFFIPGRGNERQKYTILCTELASQGYIVVAMDQPYVANFVQFPDATRVTLTLKDAWYLPRDRDYRYQYDDEVISGAISDIDYVLHHFEDFGKISKAMDKNKIILMGHSLGGNVAHIMGFKDPRIKAIVDIDSKITERSIFGHIGIPPNSSAKPILFIRGMMQYQEDVKDQLVKTAKSTTWSPYVQHSAFSDEAYFAAKISGYREKSFLETLWCWLLKQGPFFSATDIKLGTYHVDEWFANYPKYIVTWLNKTVR